MAEETPFQLVQRRFAEGAPSEALEVELLGLGLDRAEIAQLEGDWALALATKMKAEGFPAESIAQELECREFSPGDVHALLLEQGMPVDPPRPRAAITRGIATVQLSFGILLLVSGLLMLLADADSVYSTALDLIGGANVVGAVGSDHRRRAKQAEARSKMAPLADDDPQVRCALHSKNASLGSCPRCGSFCCGRCAPLSGFARGDVCIRCQLNPEVRGARLRRASRVAAYSLLAAPATILLVAAIDRFLSANHGSVPLARLAIGSAPWLLLALVQANIHGRWPTVVSVVPWLVMAFVLAGGPAIELVVWLIPLGAAFYGVGISLAARRVQALVPSYRTIGPRKQSETSSSA